VSSAPADAHIACARRNWKPTSDFQMVSRAAVALPRPRYRVSSAPTGTAAVSWIDARAALRALASPPVPPAVFSRPVRSASAVSGSGLRGSEGASVLAGLAFYSAAVSSMRFLTQSRTSSIDALPGALPR